MSLLSTGKIYFITNLYDDLYDDLSFFVQEKANKNRIGINLVTNISQNAKRKYESETASDNWMIFELTESSWYCQCENLFTPVYYDSKYENCLGIDLSESRLPNIQAFLQNVLEHELISHIIFELETCFALPEEFICCNIEADQFCDTVNDAYKNKKSMMMPPVIRINISKESRQINESR